ncbi:helix-turn-helix domain-containing protein [Rhodopseudomonas palustris]|uniref:helix-turn-helix domain-containing protein n=1 Tax=Rhodopseudomonas palustris TaxID=1076 RepID=UPI0020CD8ADE|nr:helix-turn-helix domain-containing protein [Rhodopseudomonas palustris]
MNNALSLAPSSALRVCCFDDIDQYRWSAEGLQLDFTPLARKISARQLIVNLPGCDIIVERTFPRLIDAKLMPGRTAIVFSMSDESMLQINGVDLDSDTLVLGYDRAIFVGRETTPIWFACVVFKQDMRDRGWPAAAKGFDIFTLSRPAHHRLRALVQDVATFASRSPDDIRKPEVARGIDESLLAAVDEALADSVSIFGARSAHTERFLTVVKGIDEIISENPANPIYSGDLARALGVSVRTIHTAVLQYRGMSLHRYLRLKRLWQVRQRLLSGNISVKACALAYGFWHLSDFSRSYRTLFGELPSQTLALAH